MITMDKEIKYEYIYKVNRVIDYIRIHYADNLDLEKIAKIAHLSKYHFHRIFRSQTGETINEFIRRHRLEFAFYKLGAEGKKSITEIALDCGFSSSQNFAKAFKKYFNVSPKFVHGEYNWYKMRGIGDHTNNLSEKEDCPRTAYFSDTAHEKFNSLIKKISEQKKSLQVNIVEMPSFHVAYIRTIGLDLEKHRQAGKKLSQWADARGLLNANSLSIGVSNSDPLVTPPEKIIYDKCVTIPENIEKDEKVNIQDIPGGKYAVYHCEVDMHDLMDGFNVTEEWMRFLIDWLQPSGYHLDTRPAYQIHYNDYEKHPLKYMIVDLCLPIKPL
jgi:AraC family transcriptional regulator